MAKFKTIYPLMLVGGLKRMRSDDACLIDTDDPLEIAYLRGHPYCTEIKSSEAKSEPMKELDDGAADKRGTGSAKGRNRRAVDESEQPAEKLFNRKDIG